MSYNQYQSNPYQQAPAAEQGGYDYNQGAYSSYDQNQGHEMQNYGAPQQPQPQAPHVLSQQDFLGRIGFLRNEIGSVTRNIEAIASLHQRSLAESDGGLSSQQLERIVTETRNLNASIRDQLKFLANDAAKTQDSSRSLKERQVNTIKNEFERELHSYQNEESTFRQRYRDQIARQYRIVNPDASEDEVRQAAEADWGNEGVFQTALRSNRAGQAASVLGNVRARHNELQRIEQTLMELASMFQDLAMLVEQQDVAVVAAEQNAENTTKHLEEGNQHVKKGIISAQNARKYKWWCLLVVVLIIIVVILAVVLTLRPWEKK
ncbi:t-SNARE [Microdochium trichocladiopsis]|uniref:t-SNARE n=1 Tax=Microdochium trichocladiopsis TaxID=1682393 RepID=A0A9P8XZS7_9PEZI|nr:t-SNARE [Microdochium trichocladiopsis]KAH7026179.1 t-SNARE [Microdochium trichocladiopsis]